MTGVGRISGLASNLSSTFQSMLLAEINPARMSRVKSRKARMWPMGSGLVVFIFFILLCLQYRWWGKKEK